MSLTRGKRIILPLTGKASISGTITLVISSENICIHVSQELRKKQLCQGSIEAVDFGYTEVMTDTQGVHYGMEFGFTLHKTSEALHQKMRKRHKLHAIKDKANPMKAKKICKYNLGKKKQIATQQRTKSSLRKEINTGVNQLIKTKRPSILITEDLRHVFTYKKFKAVNRKLSSWCRGELQDRVAFKALAEGFCHKQVNPAYGSQSCPLCEFVDYKNRKQDRFQCLHCGHADQSDRIAAINYPRRFGDPKIERYTPYRNVKSILLSRFHRRLETERSVTVASRTLETVKPSASTACFETSCHS